MTCTKLLIRTRSEKEQHAKQHEGNHAEHHHLLLLLLVITSFPILYIRKLSSIRIKAYTNNNTYLEQKMSNRVCHFKLVLLGDAAVGKSCLVVRFVRDEFFEFQEPTIGGTFLSFYISDSLIMNRVLGK